MIREELIKKTFKELDRIIPKLQTPIVELVEARTKDPFKILIATILSARTKDALLSKKLPEIFKEINNLEDLEKISLKKLEKIIYPIGFYKTKTKHLKQIPQVIKQEFLGKIPETIDELIRLPGVGRKTANLVRTIAFKKPAICVDVHVHRISNRLGWIKTKTPLETEMKLREILPLKYWSKINTYLVSYGQSICSPISPHCSECKIKKYCKQINVKTQR